MTRAAPDPYRLFFPIGVAYGLVGAALWPLHALGWIPYPAPLHWTLMIQGFQHSFVLGFLLTAMPSFLHAQRCQPAELAIGTLAMVAFGGLSLLGLHAPAQGAYLATLALVAVMAARRFRREEPPPEEFLLVAAGLLMGLAGAVASLGTAAGWIEPPAPRFPLHLISLGMVLALVLGVGGLLVPTFSSMRNPLVIPGLAAPHERKPRRILYFSLALLLLAALALEAGGRGAAAAWTRAVAGSAILLWVWKIFRLPGVKDLLSYCLWLSGWMLLAGLWTAALLSGKSIAGYHLIFIGGFGLLTLGIGTRVVIRHGRHPLPEEGRVLRTGVVAAMGLALAARLGAEFAPGAFLALIGLSGAAWIAAWLLWGLGATRYIARVAAPASSPPPGTVPRPLPRPGPISTPPPS